MSRFCSICAASNGIKSRQRPYSFAVPFWIFAHACSSNAKYSLPFSQYRETSFPAEAGSHDMFFSDSFVCLNVAFIVILDFTSADSRKRLRIETGTYSCVTTTKRGNAYGGTPLLFKCGASALMNSASVSGGSVFRVTLAMPAEPSYLDSNCQQPGRLSIVPFTKNGQQTDRKTCKWGLTSQVSFPQRSNLRPAAIR